MDTPHLKLLTKFNYFTGSAADSIPLIYNEILDSNGQDEMKNTIILGRGSLSKPVHYVVSANRDNKEIMSRNHAKINIYKLDDEIKYEIEDMGSMNGVFINGDRIEKQELKGNTNMFFQLIICNNMLFYILWL